MSDARLRRIVEDLRSRGVELGELEALQTELDALEEPPGLLRRVSRNMLDFARTQWGRVMGEVEESKEAGALLARRLAGEELTEEERATFQAQLGDMLRMVPASLIAVAMEAIPVPGTMVVTPWLLLRLGLMPSQWREVHLLDRLQAEAERLRAAHEEGAADRLDALRQTLTLEAEERAREQVDADLHVHWDADGDGHWDEEETAAYDEALAALHARVDEDGWHRRWFLWHRGRVFGPVKLEELREAAPEAPFLVTHDDVEGWVVLGQLLKAGQDGSVSVGTV